MSVTRDRARRIAARTEAWYRANARPLAWREAAFRESAGRAWATLVAETMLQQTQVERVEPKFRAFLARYPTPAALAASSERDVLAIWQGLGYYRRAKNLQLAATVIVGRFGGEVPGSEEALRSLPGVGRYTAGAVLSIGYGVPAAIVDGNVARLLSRVLGIEASDTGELWRAAEAIAGVAGNPSDLSEGLMELGAVVCRPARPACEACPLSRMCAWKRRPAVERTGVRKKSGSLPVSHAWVVVCERGESVLLAQRRAGVMWSSMYESPTFESDEPMEASEAERRLKEQFSISASLEEVGRFEHRTSSRLWRFTVSRSRGVRGRLRGGWWISRAEIDLYPLSNAQKRALSMAEVTAGQSR